MELWWHASDCADYGGRALGAGSRRMVSKTWRSVHFQVTLLILCIGTSHAGAQVVGHGGSLGFVVTSGGGLGVVFQPLTTPPSRDVATKDTSSQNSTARSVGYMGAVVAGVLTMLFIVLMTRLWTIHSLTRRSHKAYHRANTVSSSPRSSKDMSDPAVVEATIAHIQQTESFVPASSGRPHQEKLTVVSVAPHPVTASTTPAAVASPKHHPLSSSSSTTTACITTTIIENGRPKIVRIHSEFEEMESDEEAPPVPKKKAGAAKLKVAKTKSST